MHIQQKPGAREFSSNLGDIIALLSQSTTACKVEIAIDGYRTIYSQLLTPYDDGSVKSLFFEGLQELLQPYTSYLTVYRIIVTLTEYAGTTQGASESFNTWVYYHDGDLTESFADFYGNSFLSSFTRKRTTLTRKETLYFPSPGTQSRIAESSIRAYYTDGTYSDHSLTVNYDMSLLEMRYIKFSPGNYEVDGKTLYRLVAGVTTEMLDDNQEVEDTRYMSMEYIIDTEHPDGGEPVMIYMNAFGVPETLYCTGTEESDIDVEREVTTINGKTVNYRQTMTRLWNADTGILEESEVEGVLDLFRSPTIMQCRIDETGNYSKWKEVVITDQEAKYTNDDDDLPRYTFTYKNAEKNVSARGSDIQHPYIFTIQYNVFYE